MVGSVRSIRSNLGNIMAATLQETFVKIQSAIKILILFLYWDRPAKENRQSEKFHSTFNVLRKEREDINRHCFSIFSSSKSLL